MATENQYVKISVNELSDLIEAKETLAALECGGVDNWEWYGECFPDDWDEYIENMTSNITKNYAVLE